MPSFGVYFLIGCLTIALCFSVFMAFFYRHRWKKTVQMSMQKPNDDVEAENREDETVPEIDLKQEDDFSSVSSTIATDDSDLVTSIDHPLQYIDKDIELFAKLKKDITDNYLYLNSKFGRAEIVKRYHLTDHRVGAVFSSQNTSIPAFIRDCRLVYAREMIKKRPTASLAEVANSSGFLHLSTFTREFKKKYGIPPSQYRSQRFDR